MIIQCDRCGAKFKIDDDRLTEEGVRVKCKKCQHIFVAKKPLETSEDLRIDEGFFSQEEEAEKEEGFLQIPQEEDLSWASSLTSETSEKDFFQESSLPQKDKEEKKPAEQSLDDEFLFSFEPQAGETEPSIGKEEKPAPETEIGEACPAESYDMATAEDDLEGINLDTQLDTQEEAQKTDIYGGGEEYKEEFPDEMLIPAGIERQSSSKRKFLILSLLLLILLGSGLMIKGNLETLTKGFPTLTKMIGEKTLDKDAPLGLIGLKGYYQANEKEGVLFVIEGRLVNPSEVARSFTSIKGTIFDKEGKVFEEKTINLGKLLTKEQLSKLSREDIEKSLTGGIETLPPGKPSPFIVVFYQVPQDLSEFLVEVEE